MAEGKREDMRMEGKEPLTESYFYILLCLCREPMHGYGIMLETARLSDGRVRIGSGTMYGAVSNMMKKGWIQEYSTPEDDRKRRYRITQEGQYALEAEVWRLRQLLENAEKQMEGTR